MTARIVLLGATGYTGALVLESLRARGIKPVLAGRDEAAVAALAKRHGGLDSLRVDVTDAASVAGLVGAGDVLISTVGPFERYGYAVAEAAAEVGAHYLDSSGEVGFALTLRQRLDARARANGSVMVPGFGYDYVPGVLAGTLALEEAGPAARSVDIGYFATGPLWRGLSQGTRTTMRDGQTLPSARWRDHRLIEERTASATHTFTVRGRRRSGFLVSGTEVVHLPEAFPTLANVSVYNGWFPALARAATIGSAITAATLRIPGGRALVDLITRPAIGRPGGPDATERSRTRTHVVALASSETTQLAEVHLEGPSIYDLTGELLAWGAQRLASGTHPATGVVGPIAAFGSETLMQGCVDIGLVTV
ncbi:MULTISPECIES: saccharopine dehydrogenase NADP-binding domain-containing protein [unclassified Mycobacterium]|uniref:saccharopine dehydrogenase family protein n=1 Tax=unclassified Mycobacterium TaxID=2642494 RepID=UPI00099335D1|nr:MULTISPECIES: saccharopine dehydrogenase NADP-binding domain-containing protein [unclassified Mycobacterium]